MFGVLVWNALVNSYYALIVMRIWPRAYNLVFSQPVEFNVSLSDEQYLVLLDRAPYYHVIRIHTVETEGRRNQSLGIVSDLSHVPIHTINQRERAFLLTFLTQPLISRELDSEVNQPQAVALSK